MFQNIVRIGSAIVLAMTSISLNAATDEQAQRILRRAIDAVGGERNLTRFKGPMMWMERGTFHGMGEGLPFVAQYTAKWPDWHRQEVEGAFVITASGDQAWVMGAGGSQLLEGETLKETLAQVRMAWATRLFPLLDGEYQLRVMEGVTVDGRQTVGLLVQHSKQRDMKFYFDKETHLIAKIETMVVSPQHGADPVLSETYCLEHKSISGVKVPSKLKVLYDKKPFVDAEVVDYKLGATLDPQQFQVPK